MGDAAQLGRTLDGDVVSHEPDEGDPDAERRSAVHEGLVTLGEVKLLPRLRRRHFGTPATMKLSLQAPRARRLGHVRSFHMDLSHPQGFHPKELALNNDSGGCAGKFSIWRRRT